MFTQNLFPLLVLLMAAVASAIIAYVMNTALPFGSGSRCPKKRTIRLRDGGEVILVAPDPNMTIGMAYAEAKDYGYADSVSKELLAGEVAAALSKKRWWQPKGWQTYDRVVGRDSDGAVWALDTHDGKVFKLSHMAECDGCLVAIADLATAEDRKPESAAA